MPESNSVPQGYHYQGHWFAVSYDDIMQRAVIRSPVYPRVASEVSLLQAELG